jgi:hypothetical protein
VALNRFHGVFTRNSGYRARVTPAKRGKGGKHHPGEESDTRTPAERRASMSWAQRPKRDFAIDKSAREPIKPARPAAAR